MDLVREGSAPQQVDALSHHRGTTEPGGVRASCGRDDSKIQAEQVGRGSCSHRESPSLSAMSSSSTTPACHQLRVAFSGHVRATVRPLGVEHCRGLREVRSLQWQGFFTSNTAC